MKYIQDGLFKGPVPINISDPEKGIEEHKATIKDALLLFLNAYAPSPREALAIGDLRKLNKAIDDIESSENGLIALEDDYFNITKRTVEMAGPTLIRLARNTPALVDILEAATSEKAETEEEDKTTEEDDGPSG